MLDQLLLRAGTWLMAPHLPPPQALSLEQVRSYTRTLISRMIVLQTWAGQYQEDSQNNFQHLLKIENLILIGQNCPSDKISCTIVKYLT